ncbi:transcription termination factor 4, mitochondrial [Colius striatus]|uniref:transcription termination factor 4, mitochondrial n=1 Tax=Colius striatus TaxID=57412 RepID=UPI002B1E8CC7|nr:transcription termination factor 4, mitochondrial [Colius striatus]
MAGRLLRGAGRAAAAGWAPAPRGLPGPGPRGGCGAAAGLRAPGSGEEAARPRAPGSGEEAARPRAPGSGEEAARLRAMGFGEEQARRLLALQPEPGRGEAAAAELLLLGLSAGAALALLERSPALLRMPAARLRERAGELRRLGLDGAPLQRALGRLPQLLTAPRRRLAAAERLLRERCLFTAEQLREVLATCPAVLLEEPRCLHLHFQYAYFRMGVRQKEMVKARLFQVPFGELRNRHIFLERRGLYQTPYKGQTQSSNPKLKDVLRLPEKDFLASMACASPEEYEVFKKLLAREEEEEEKEEQESDSDEDSDGEGS